MRRLAAVDGVRGRRHVNLPVLGRVLGMLLVIEGLFMIGPMALSLAEGGADALGFVVGVVVTLAVGLGAQMAIRPRNKDLGKRDGILLTALVWVVFSLFGMIPFMFHPLRLDFFDAFFESMSGFTTTGASVFDNVEWMPRGIHLWRCMMQWIGGIGIIIFTIALLPMFNSSGGMQMYNAELSGITHDKVRPRISQTAKRFWLIYALLTLVLIALLWLGPMGVFDSVCHALATVSTGGFSTIDASIGGWNSMYVRLAILVFMFIGGVNFVLIYRASIGQVGRAWRDTNFRAYVYIIMAATIFVVIALLSTIGFIDVKHSIVDPLFQVVSFATSTGYIIDDAASWPSVVIPVFLFLMFMGACAGSTGGGVKVDRLVYLWKNARNELRRVVHPNRVYPVAINGTVRQPELVVKVGAFMTFYVIIIFVCGTLLTLSGMSLSDAFFSTFSCISNTGVAMADASSFGDINEFGKMLLSLVMLIGRLEIFTILILFARSFWRR